MKKGRSTFLLAAFLMALPAFHAASSSAGETTYIQSDQGTPFIIVDEGDTEKTYLVQFEHNYGCGSAWDTCEGAFQQDPGWASVYLATNKTLIDSGTEGPLFNKGREPIDSFAIRICYPNFRDKTFFNLFKSGIDEISLKTLQCEIKLAEDGAVQIVGSTGISKKEFDESTTRHLGAKEQYKRRIQAELCNVSLIRKDCPKRY